MLSPVSTFDENLWYFGDALELVQRPQPVEGGLRPRRTEETTGGAEEFFGNLRVALGLRQVAQIAARLAARALSAEQAHVDARAMHHRHLFIIAREFVVHDDLDLA